MKILQEYWTPENKWTTIFTKGNLESADIVFCFGNRALISDEQLFQEIKSKYSSAEIIFSSTSGEILDSEVYDKIVALTAIKFEHTIVKGFTLNIETFKDGEEAGKALIHKIPVENLSHLFIISDGRLVNGSELVRGLNTLKQEHFSVTGGMAGDGFEYTKTLVGLNTLPQEGVIAGIAFYGNRLKVGMGSKGGWDTFGPERVVTKSKGNILYELDGISALELYKKYLGEEAKGLPESAFYFPLAIKNEKNQEPIVRGVLAISEEDHSMTCAGDIAEGATAQMMMHNNFHLIDGAERAAKQSLSNFSAQTKPEVAILVSCVGRKIVMGQYIDEEVEAVKELLGPDTAITGFYSYGEISPNETPSECELHNLTMTITTFTEI